MYALCHFEQAGAHTSRLANRRSKLRSVLLPFGVAVCLSIAAVFESRKSRDCWAAAAWTAGKLAFSRTICSDAHLILYPLQAAWRFLLTANKQLFMPPNLTASSSSCRRETYLQCNITFMLNLYTKGDRLMVQSLSNLRLPHLWCNTSLLCEKDTRVGRQS